MILLPSALVGSGTLVVHLLSFPVPCVMGALCIHENVEIPYNRYSIRRSIALKKVLKAHYAPGSRTWVRDVLLELSASENRTLLPLLLDISELVDLLTAPKVIHFSCKQTRHAAKKRFLETVQKKTPIFCQHDDVKYQELLSKLVNDIPESGEAA